MNPGTRTSWHHHQSLVIHSDPRKQGSKPAARCARFILQYWRCKSAFIQLCGPNWCLSALGLALQPYQRTRRKSRQCSHAVQERCHAVIQAQRVSCAFGCIACYWREVGSQFIHGMRNVTVAAQLCRESDHSNVDGWIPTPRSTLGLRHSGRRLRTIERRLTIVALRCVWPLQMRAHLPVLRSDPQSRGRPYSSPARYIPLPSCPVSSLLRRTSTRIRSSSRARDRARILTSMPTRRLDDGRRPTDSARHPIFHQFIQRRKPVSRRSSEFSLFLFVFRTKCGATRRLSPRGCFPLG